MIETIRILNAEPGGYSDTARRMLRKLGELREEDCDREGLLKAVSDVDVLIVRLKNNVDRELLESAPKLRVIVSATTGLDHIDLEAAERRGVSVLSLRGEHVFLSSVTATAELAWALLLALIRKIPAAFDDVKARRWDRDRFRGIQLSGRTLGIIGLGRLGRALAQYGLAFNMNVVAVDPDPGVVPAGVRTDSLDAVLTCSDVVSIHVPLNQSTMNLIGAREIALMKETAVLVNTSRGDVVDQEALISALSEERLGGAALDVMVGETSGDEDWLRKNAAVQYASHHDNLILTPHIGGASTDAMAATEVFMASKLAAHLNRINDKSLGADG